MSKNEFLWPVRVYYEDTDAGGVVYYANYLKFMERARTEMLRSLGVEQDEVLDKLGLLFVVHSMSVQYKKPARFNDELEVASVVSKFGRASLDFSQKIIRKNDMTSLCEAEIKIASLNAETFSPVSIPENISRNLKEMYCGN